MSGYTAYGKNGVKYTGSDKGYNSGYSAGVKSTTGTASASNILTGKTAWVNGSKITGTMKNYSSTIQTASTDASDQTKSCYRINGSNIEVVPAIGYWGTWNWAASCIKVPLVDVSGNSLSSVSHTYYNENNVNKGSWIDNQKIGFSATVGAKYIAAGAGDPGNYQNFKLENATLISNITAGDTPPNGSVFIRIILFKATSGWVVIDWGSNALSNVVKLT